MSLKRWFSHVEVSTSQSLDLSNDEITVSTKLRVNHCWTIEDKIVLSILADWYLNKWSEKALIFNSYFQGVDLVPSRRTFLSEKNLRSTWWHLQYSKPMNGARDIEWYDTAFSDTSVAWAALRTSLEGVGSELGIVMEKKTTRNRPDMTETPRSTRVIKRKRITIPSDDSSPEDEEISNPPSIRRRLFASNQTPTRQGPHPSQTGLATPPSSSQKVNKRRGSYALKTLPRFAYRAFNRKSAGQNSGISIRAGRFIEPGAIPSPPSTQTLAYRADALRHLNATPNGSTPFISVTRNLIRAFHHGLKMGSDSSIAVIDLHKVERPSTDDEHRFFARVQSVKGLHLDNPDNYIGNGEYLIWGEITENAICSCQPISHILSDIPNNGTDSPFYLDIIGSAKYSTMARNQIKKARTPLTTRNGEAVGNLLRALQIPGEHLEDAIYFIISDWRFQASRSGMWRKNRAFVQGIHQGYRKISHETPLLESQSEDLSDDSLIFYDTEDEQGDEKLSPRAGGGMSGVGKIQDIGPRDVEIKGESSSDEASEDTASKNRTIVNTSDKCHIEGTDQMNQSSITEELWEREFLNELREVIDLKRPN